MASDADRPFIGWLIPVYDGTAEERFPFKRKWYRFNYSRATQTEIQEVLRLVGHGQDDDWHDPLTEIGESRLSFHLGGGGFANRGILRYRHLFDFVPDEKMLTDGIREAGASVSGLLAPDSYFEDENEKPITLLEVFDEEAEREDGSRTRYILMNCPESVLRLGPAEPVRPELWKASDAELMSRLFEVHAQLVQSPWIESPCRVWPVDKERYDAVLPLSNDCMAVVLPFRQLYSRHASDDLFNRCCKCHSRHCAPNHPSCSYVEYHKAQFNRFLDEAVSFPAMETDLSARHYLNAFAYGANVVHATSKKTEPASDWDKLLGSNAKQLVVMGYHFVLHTLLRFVSLAIPVLRQNVTHWIKDLGWEGPELPSASNPFGS